MRNNIYNETLAREFCDAYLRPALLCATISDNGVFRDKDKQPDRGEITLSFTDNEQARRAFAALAFLMAAELNSKNNQK